MPSLLEALSTGFDTIGTKKSSSDFARKLETYKNAIVNEYMKYNIDLNTLIAKLAKKDNLGDDHIQRIVEEVNNQVYLIKYNQMKNSPDRDVVFDLASLKKVNEAISGTQKEQVLPHYSSDKVASSNRQGIEKKASWETEKGDSLNMFNYSPHEFSSLSPEVHRTETNIRLEKIAKDIQDIDMAIDNGVNKVARSSYTIADALIQYSRHGIDAQDIFNDICKTASCSPKDQLMIKKSVDQRVGHLKSYRKLPEDYDLKLEIVDITKEASEFSLKRYSFMKEAEFSTRSNNPVPIVVTDEGVIRDLNDLIGRVTEISKDKQIVKDNVAKKEDILRVNNLTEAQGEKLAAAGRGISAFGRALTGANVRSSKKVLNETAENLSRKMNNEKLDTARKAVDKLSRARKNPDIHPRMKRVNETLSDAFEKYEGVASRTDNILNENALKNPLNPSRYFGPGVLGAKKDRFIGKQELGRTQNMAKNQTRRIAKDIDKQVLQSKRSLANIESEVDIEKAQKAVSDAEKAYSRAVSSRKKARGVALVGTGGALALNESKKKNQGKGQALYY